MEKFLKKKKTMQEYLRDNCSNEQEYIKVFKAESIVKASNLSLPTFVYTPKRSSEVTKLNDLEVAVLCKNINEKFNQLSPTHSDFLPKEYVGNPDDQCVLELDIDENRKSLNRIEYVKSHSHYYPVLSKIDFELLRKKITKFEFKQPTIMELAEEFNVSYNIMYRAIKFVLNMKYLKCSRLNIKSQSKLNDLQFLLYMKYYVEYMNQGKEFLYIDECSFNNSKRGGMRWIDKNTEKVVFDKVRVSGISLILCVSKKGVIYQETLSKTIDSKTFCSFIDNLQVKLTENIETFNKYKSGNYVLVMDNASCHVSKETYNHMKFGKFNVLTLPPYCPFYNLAEYAFNMLKKRFYAMNITKK